MERLEKKKIKGHTYYYYSEWGWVNGKCRRIWQKYLGKPKDIYKAVVSDGPILKYAEVFRWGLPTALWKAVKLFRVIEETDKLCPKRAQGLTTGQYLAVAAVNRAIQPTSKRSMWTWFSDTVLLRLVPQASKDSLTSQRFWDHMGRISGTTARLIWQNIIKNVLRRENIDLSSICCDGTNFYTFIDTFNVACRLANRGKNKQGRTNLRQVSYALFCSADGHIPLFYDVYKGNRHDAAEFPIMLEKFHTFLCELSNKQIHLPEITIVFDKGNNSHDNFVMLDSLKLPQDQSLKFVGSVKLGEHKELAEILNDDARFVACLSPKLEGTKSFRIKKKVYGKERVLVVTYNQSLFNAQWRTVQNDISKALDKLGILKQKLDDRANGIVTRGRKPTVQSTKSHVTKLLTRPYMKQIITTEISGGPNNVRLDYSVNTAFLTRLAQTQLGKNIIISNQEQWDNEMLIKSYRSQFIIEDVFKEMKDRVTGSWWPLYHWTDSKILVHGLYCTIALLLRAVLLRKVRLSGLNLSMKRFLCELDGIREVINVYKSKGRKKTSQQQTTLTRTTELQNRLVRTLGLDKVEK